MATKLITLLDGTTAYAHDVETLVDPLYTDIDDTNIASGADIQVAKLKGGTDAQLLISNGAVPMWQTLSGNGSITNGGVLTVTSTTSLNITADNTNTAIMYPTWVKANSGSQAEYVSTQLTFQPSTGQPSTGTLTAPIFAGHLVGNADTADTATTADHATLAANLDPGIYTYDGTGGASARTMNAAHALSADTVTNAADATNEAPHAVVQLTTGSGNWVVPAGVTRLKVICVGGGGGGGGGGGVEHGGGGGGGTNISEVLAQIVTVTPAQVIAYSVGTGGAGGAIFGNNGGDGIASTFGGITSGYGGGGLYTGLGGAGSADNAGSPGQSGFVSSVDFGGTYLFYKSGGNGGGNGGLGSYIVGTYAAVGGIGGGGGGGSGYNGIEAAGAAGGPGIIIIEY